MATRGKDKSPEAVRSSTAKVEEPVGAFASQLDLISLSHEPVFAWDWDLGIIDWNAGAERQYGFTRADALGKNSHELLASKHPVSISRFLKKLAADGYWRGEVRHTTKDGTELIVDSRQQIIARNGRKIVVESDRDISERRAAESQIAILIIIGDLIRTINDPNDLLYETAKTVGVYFNARRCVFSEVDLENDVEIIYRDYHRSGRSVAGRHRLSSYSPITFEDMKEGRVVRNADSKIDPRTTDLYKRVYERTGERSYVAVPLMRDRQWKASLWISDDQPREWAEAEVALLKVIAERVWLAVEKHRSDESLRASRAELDLIVTHTPFMLTLCGSDLRYKFVSRSYAEMLGRRPEDLVNMPIVEIIGKKGFETIRPHIEAVLRGEKVEYEDEVSFLGAGSRYLRGSYVPELDAQNRVIGWVASLVDISERVRSENLLRESEESYRILAESASDAILSIDESSTIGFVNTAATRIFGYAEAEMTGQSLTILMPEELRPQHRAGFGRYLETGVKKLNWESVHITARHKDGRHFPIEISFGEYNRDGKRFFIGVARDVTEQNKAIEALRESEQRRQLAQDAANIGIFDADLVTGKTYWSETMWSFYGEADTDTNPDEQYWLDHLHDLDRDRVKRHLRSILENGEDYRDEYRIIQKSGCVRWIEARARVVRDASGKAVRKYGVNIDITSRKEAEEKIQQSDDQLRLVTDSVPVLISYVDKYERFRFANETFTDWFGIPKAEVIGKQSRDVFGAAAYKVLRPWINDALSGKKCAFDTVLSYNGIDERHVSVSYIPEIGADGTVNGYYALTHDRTALRHSEDLVRSTNERIGLITDSFTDYAIFSMDKNGIIETWNPGAEMIFGYSRDEVVGRSYEFVFTPDDLRRGVWTKEMRNSRLKGRSIYEGWRLKKDGSRFFASAVMMPLYVGDTLTGYSKIVSDLTKKHRQAEELQRAHDELEVRVEERTKELAESNAALVKEMSEREIAEKQRIELLGRLVSSQEFERRRFARDLHDQLGQRLTALRLKLASLHELVPDDEKVTSRINRLEAIAEQLDSEVNFLAWELRPAALDDLGVLEAIRTFVNEWARHFEISADFHPSGLPAERLEREVETHLYRITQEALNNIAKHADAKHVTVLLEKREQNIMLIIEDDGIGFDLKENRGQGEYGAGLGLTGMGERAALIGGEIEIESAPNCGTTIYVRLPYSQIT